MAPARPNNKTLVMLDGLPLSTTNESLRQAIGEMETVRKCEVEPGCALHVVDEVGASCLAKEIEKQLKMNSTVRNTCLPSVVLKNLPSSVNSQAIFSSFQKYNPMAVRFSGKRSVLVTVTDGAEALEVLRLVKTMTIDGQNLSGHITSTPEGRYCVQVSDIPQASDLTDALKAVSSTVNEAHPNATLSVNTGTTTVKVRMGASKYSSQKLEEFLSRVSFGENSPLSTAVKSVPRPTLILRNVSKVDEDTLRTFCVEDLNAERVQRTWRTGEMLGDMAFVYFTTESDAYAAIQKIKQANLGSHKIKASYKEMSEPAVKISGIAHDMTSKKLEDIFSHFRVHRIDMLPVSESGSDVDTGREAVIVVSDYKEADKLRETVNLRKFDGVQYCAEENNISDSSLEFVFFENEAPSVDTCEKALRDAGVEYRSVVSSSDVQAFVAFESLDHATRSQGAFVQGDIKLAGEKDSSIKTVYDGAGGNAVASALTVYPSYAIEVKGISPEESAEAVLNVASEQNVEVFKSERSAAVKFKRHKYVVPGMKQLRAITIGDVKLRPRRYHELEEEGDSEYDTESEPIKQFDRNHLHMMLKDYLTAEPAIRYQIAKNYFERALFTAQGLSDITYILEDDAPQNIKAEAKGLLKEKNDIDQAMKPYANDEDHSRVPKDLKNRLDSTVNRLFQLFVQREDMARFSHDFDDIEAALGPANPEDIYEWNNFMCNDEERLKQLSSDLRYYTVSKADRRDAAREAKIAAKKAKRRERREGLIHGTLDQDSSESSEAKEAAGDEGSKEKQEGESEDSDFLEGVTEKEQYDRFDADYLRDHDGHLWSGVIIHQDTTQKVVPGERLISYRCLVSIGNRRGAGGFGMGKGADSDIALRNAFRDALKNLVYIDLYENAALAHDLKGKHNDCIVYIRATPKSREMVASPLATSIFNSFGIVSCSAKIVGNRQPYAMVRAIYNALSKHKNIDEIAKERGMRYLTLKWMYDNGM